LVEELAGMDEMVVPVGRLLLWTDGSWLPL
jgi:hypothetical protein